MGTFNLLWCAQLKGRKCIISLTIASKRESLVFPTFSLILFVSSHLRLLCNFIAAVFADNAKPEVRLINVYRFSKAGIVAFTGEIFCMLCYCNYISGEFHCLYKYSFFKKLDKNLFPEILFAKPSILKMDQCLIFQAMKS